jgi:hypothetical protein
MTFEGFFSLLSDMTVVLTIFTLILGFVHLFISSPEPKK